MVVNPKAYILPPSGVLVENCYNVLMSMSTSGLLSIILVVLIKVAQKMLYSKALGAYHSIFKNFSNLDSVPVKVLLKLFSALISPILLYCSEVWGVHLLGSLTNIEMFKKFFSMISDIEKLHIKFCKRILGVHSKSTNLAAIAELLLLFFIIKTLFKEG